MRNCIVRNESFSLAVRMHVSKSPIGKTRWKKKFFYISWCLCEIPLNTMKGKNLKSISYGIAPNGFSLCLVFNLNVLVWTSPQVVWRFRQWTSGTWSWEMCLSLVSDMSPGGGMMHLPLKFKPVSSRLGCSFAHHTENKCYEFHVPILQWVNE